MTNEINRTTGTETDSTREMGGNTGRQLTGDWNRDRDFWRDSYESKPYASADRRFEDHEPGYRFGYESSNRYPGKKFDDVESNLRTDWDSYEGRGQSTWENVKDSVRDTWDNLTGKR